MATKKREIYARAATQLRTHDRPRLAEKACPGAMGLYLFLLIQARGEQTGGCSSEEAAWESWSAPIAYRKKQAEALILAGLVARIDGRLHVIKYEEHNDTPADIESAKERARVRMYNVRERRAGSPDVQRTEPEHTGDVPISISSSLSGSGSREGMQGETGPPEWFGVALESVSMQTGETLRPADSWLRYSGHRAGKGIAPNQQDAVYWLATVMVPEARRERRADADKVARDTKWDQKRAGPEPPPKPTAEQSKAFARELVARVQGRRGAA